MASMILDILVAVLLVITIGYAVSLNKKLGALRKHKDEMQELALGFADATRRAEDSISKLKSTSESAQIRMDKAQGLQDDLIFLIDRGTGLADKLEAQIRNLRGETGIGPQASALATENLSPLSKITASELQNGDADKTPAVKAKTKKSLPDRDLRARKDDFKTDGQSKAEKDLLKALRSAG